jgi:lipopolysaccharide transport system permease protein
LFGFTRYDIKLLLNLLKMNVRDRYLGSSLGSFWAITNPLFMLCLYTYVFGFVFKVKLPDSETTLAYVIWLISGYGPWIATTEAIMGATSSVTGAAGMVKNMAFKTELLPIAGALVGSINLAVSLVFLMVLLVITSSPITWHLLLMPFIVVIHFMFVVALGIWLSVFAVFVRDIIQVLPTVLTAVMFITPIFYPFSSMPKFGQMISQINPFYYLSEAYRAVLIGNQIPGLTGLCYVAVLSLTIFLIGLTIFRRAKGSFDSAI